MKQYLFLLLAIFFFSSLRCQLLLKLENDTLIGYYYKGGDEFNESVLNTDMWINGLGGRRVLMSQDLAFSPLNVKLEEGLINFQATKKDSIYKLSDVEIDSTVLK